MARDLTPTELAREVGMERRDVTSLCLELGIPIFEGRISRELFEGALGAVPGAAHVVLFDSAGNMIESFDSAGSAMTFYRQMPASDRSDVRLIAFDEEGNVLEPRSPSRTQSRT